jgi:hypothetical protein
MDHVRFDPTRRKPARQPEAVATGFEGQRNPRDRGRPALTASSRQQCKTVSSRSGLGSSFWRG